MKKYLQKDRFRLDEQEKLGVWREVSRPFAREAARPRRPRWLLPTLSTAAVAAALTVMIYVGQDGPPVAELVDLAGPAEPAEAARQAAPPAGPVVKTADTPPVESRSEAAAVAADRVLIEGAPPAADVVPSNPRHLPATLDLRVFDRASGERLPDAAVILFAGTDSLFALLMADDFPRPLPAGRYDVRISHLGYAPSETTIAVLSGQRLELALGCEVEVVQTLAAFDVEAGEHRVDATGVVSEQKTGSGKFPPRSTGAVNDASPRQAGAVTREGELYVRGGRSGEVSHRVSGIADEERPAAGAGGEPADGVVPVVPPDGDGRPGARLAVELPSRWWVPPNSEPYDLVYHEHYGTNPFIVTAEDALSTFAIDVDNASYTIARRYLRDRNLPDKDSVRVEEWINFFEQGYPAVTGGDFAVRVDGAPSPYGEGYHLLRVGLQAREVAAENRRPANLIFVIDVSGSMDREDRLELVKQALHILIGELQERDAVGLVTYGSHGQVVLEPTSSEERRTLIRAIDSLAPGGSTHAEEGLDLAYDMARRHFQRDAVNRLILCSDGVANQGRTGAEDILRHVRGEADRGIGLSTIGFGMGNFNDVLMEKLADQGDGNYYYVDDLKEARRVFQENLTGTLQTIARDTKIQVQFEPAHVLRYRLLGYENRDVADEDFRNDAVDAGEVGAGHQVTALYEIKLSDEAAFAIGKGRRDFPALATVRLRYEIPAHAAKDGGKVIELAQPVTTASLVDAFDRAGLRLQQDALVAEFAEILRQSYWAKDSRLSRLVPLAAHLARSLPEDPEVVELEALVGRAAGLQDRRDRPERPVQPGEKD